MGIGIGILLIAVGAILTFAVHTTLNGIDIQTVGIILMVVGALGLLIDLVIFAPRRRRYARETVADTGEPVSGERTVTRDSVDGTY